MSNERFQIVRTSAGYHARFKGANNETVWTTEVYTRKSDAINAIALLDRHIVAAGAVHWRKAEQVDER